MTKSAYWIKKNIMNITAYYNGNITTSRDRETYKNVYRFSDMERKKQRKFTFKYKHYRKISSAAAYMFDNKVNKIIFLTFTIKDNIDDNRITNPAFSDLLLHMRKYMNVHSYIWVAERQKRGAIHYHALFDMPFIDFQKIAAKWSRFCLKHGFESSVNSVSTSKKWGAIVENTDMAVKYITKYIAKGVQKDAKRDEMNVFATRNYAISNNINVKPRKLSYKTFYSCVTTTLQTYNFRYSTTYICDMRYITSIWDTDIYKDNLDYENTYNNVETTDFNRAKNLPNYNNITASYGYHAWTTDNFLWFSNVFSEYENKHLIFKDFLTVKSYKKYTRKRILNDIMDGNYIIPVKNLEFQKKLPYIC